MRVSHAPLTLDEIEEARTNIEGAAVRTPIVRLDVDVPGTEIYLKLEVLQPIGVVQDPRGGFADRVGRFR
jgi:threonine dehydratase